MVAVGAERYLITAMLRSATAMERILERLGSESFREPRLRTIFEALRDLGSNEHVHQVAERLPADAVALMDELLSEPEAILNLDRTVGDSLARLEERRLQERNREIDRLISLATDDEKTALITEKRENARQIVELAALRSSS